MLKVKNKDTTIPSLDVNGYILPCVLVILSFFEKKKKKKKELNLFVSCVSTHIFIELKQHLIHYYIFWSNCNSNKHAKRKYNFQSCLENVTFVSMSLF